MIGELINDRWLVDFIVNSEHESLSKSRFETDGSKLFGRRVGWYAVARICKPALIIETGVDRGLGSVLLCRALMRNLEEEQPGVYKGTDINKSAGYLLRHPLKKFGEILYGDSITSLRNIDQSIGLFINDSDHSAEYESLEYKTIRHLLDRNSIVLGDNSHVTSKLFEFALQEGLSFLHFQEQPAEHWYPGAGIGAAFYQKNSDQES